MIVYSNSSCPKCKVLKMKMDKANLTYDVNENIEEMQELGIKSLPYLQLEDGTLLNFGEAVKHIKTLEEQN